MDEGMTTTAFTLDGYRIVESLGVVRGVTVRSRSLLGTIGAKFETLIGGRGCVVRPSGRTSQSGRTAAWSSRRSRTAS